MGRLEGPGREAPSWVGGRSALHRAASRDLRSLRGKERQEEARVKEANILLCKNQAAIRLQPPFATRAAALRQGDVPTCPKQAGATKARTDLPSNIDRIIEASEKVSASGN